MSTNQEDPSSTDQANVELGGTEAQASLPEPGPGGTTEEAVLPANDDDNVEGKVKARPSEIALCLSGGGYRAAMFHVGVLLRLNHDGILRHLSRISCVSGGSITGACLGMNWDEIWKGTSGSVADSKRLQTYLVKPLRDLTATTIDRPSILRGLLWFGTVHNYVTQYYENLLFKDKTLQDLPTEQAGIAPRFVLNATNVKTGTLWRFAKPYMADYRTGKFLNPKTKLSVVVAASSAFPPFLSPLKLRLEDYENPTGGAENPLPFSRDLVLTDGGTYDNLGLQPVRGFGTLLVSDAGLKWEDDPNPWTDWFNHMRRVLAIIDSQVRAQRLINLMASFTTGKRRGGYWGISTEMEAFVKANNKNNAENANKGLPPNPFTPLCCYKDARGISMAVPTRLAEMSDLEQEALINWGFAICDASLRVFCRNAFPGKAITISDNATFPYPRP
ncbi:patatin [Verrucomicrobia bacterium LW23]|nr:patatin [Verrucomicrobia bacterium LW23]